MILKHLQIVQFDTWGLLWCLQGLPCCCETVAKCSAFAALPQNSEISKLHRFPSIGEWLTKCDMMQLGLKWMKNLYVTMIMTYHDLPPIEPRRPQFNRDFPKHGAPARRLTKTWSTPSGYTRVTQQKRWITLNYHELRDGTNNWKNAFCYDLLCFAGLQAPSTWGRTPKCPSSSSCWTCRTAPHWPQGGQNGIASRLP